MNPVDQTLFWIATGLSPREVRHSVVMKGSAMVHDPHPSRRGVEGIDEVSIFVPLDFGAWRHL